MKISALSPTPGLARSGQSRTGVVARAQSKIEAYMEHIRQRRDLQSLDDHLLKDIGITRADVERIARHPFKWL